MQTIRQKMSLKYKIGLYIAGGDPIYSLIRVGTAGFEPATP